MEMMIALRYAAQGVKFAVDVYKAIRSALEKEPDAQGEIDAADQAVAKALKDLPGIHAKQRAEVEG